MTDFLQQLQHFTKGDVQQGKWMIGIAIVFLLPLAFLLFSSNLPLQKGIAAPICLLIVVNIAYGSYILYSKPKHLIQTEKNFYSDPQQIINSELQKAKTDHKSYTKLKYVWGFCTIVFIVLYFLLTKDFYKGLSIGFAVLFLSFLLIDTFFHQRLSTYYKLLQNSTF